ncbi:MAG: hypothetical protein AAGG47_01520 [Pseudomonadota bacterium]
MEIKSGSNTINMDNLQKGFEQIGKDMQDPNITNDPVKMTALQFQMQTKMMLLNTITNVQQAFYNFCKNQSQKLGQS